MVKPKMDSEALQAEWMRNQMANELQYNLVLKWLQIGTKQPHT